MTSAYDYVIITPQLKCFSQRIKSSQRLFMLKPPLIMVVDDDPTIVSIVTKIIENNGYRHMIASNGQEAINQIEQTQPDIILLDLNMPVMNGFDVCKYLKSNKHTHSISILMITGQEDNESVTLAFEFGVDEFITKPIHWKILEHRINRLVEQRHQEKMLRQAEKDRGIVQIIHGIAHNFNNQLMVVNESLNHLLTDINTSKTSQWIKFAQEATNESILLTKKLSKYTTLPTIEAIPIAVNKLIAKLILSTQHSLNENVKLIHKITKPESFVATNPIELRTTLNSLIMNANQAIIDDGVIEISVNDYHPDSSDLKQYEELADIDYIKISISDTGHGINSSIKDNILDPFFTTKDKAVHQGLGLSCAYGFVRSNGGLIETSSGKKTVVTIYLPAK